MALLAASVSSAFGFAVVPTASHISGPIVDAPRFGTLNMNNAGGNFKWEPQWKKDLAKADVAKAAGTSAPAAATSAPAATDTTLDLVTMTAGQCLNILVDKSITESTDERMAFLTKNGCPQSIIDSVLKNVNLY